MDLKQLRQIWREHGFRPKKRLGQNFLIDKNVKNNILDALPPAADRTVVEIGAGFGVMSFDLAERCGKLFAVEKDSRICGIMDPVFRQKENITFTCADILELDLRALTGEQRHLTVFGNIPYCISTPVIVMMVEQRQCIDAVYLVIQEELADRLVSPPGSKQYGSISCFTQFYTGPKKLFRIKKNSFYPRPQVESCLLELEILRAPGVRVRDKELMFRIIRKAFSQRRKKIINPLSDGTFKSMNRDEWLAAFESCGLDASKRAENFSLRDYARLADAAEARNKGQG